MANKQMFATDVVQNANLPLTDTTNAAGGVAYAFSDEGKLAQLVVTSCFNNTYYLDAGEQVKSALELSRKCSTIFVAKAAVYAHETAGMKDTAALLLAVLTTRGLEGLKLFEQIAPRVLTNFKMVMNFVQIIRSSTVGRRSFGSAPKRVLRNWFAARDGNRLFTGSIGSNPSFADVIKMIRPKPENEEKKNLYGYFIGKDYDEAQLPVKVREFELFKRQLVTGEAGAVPDVPFQMLTALPLTEEHWKNIARHMPWNATRMNLNTFARHGVFKDAELTEAITKRLGDPEQVRRSNTFPYQLLAAYINTESDVPQQVRNALQDAMEVATENVPTFGKSIAVCVDTSGSMQSSVTGYRKGSTSKIECVQVAGLFAATISRRNSNTLLLPFDTIVHDCKVNPRDSIMTQAAQLARRGGGTDCSSAMRVLNGLVGNQPEVVIYVSDNESWFNTERGEMYMNYYRQRGGTPTCMADEWATYKKKVPAAKLILIDLTPNSSTQVRDQKDVMNIGGFSDRIWPAIKQFLETGSKSFADIVNQVEL